MKATEEGMLYKWIIDNPVPDNMNWKGAARRQLESLFDFWHFLWLPCHPNDDYDVKRIESMQVIGSHTSKSITLPVVSYTVPGMEMIVRGNFHDWNMSVVSPFPVESDFSLFAAHDTKYCHYQGFPEEYIFDLYEMDPCKFSTYCGTDYDLYAFMKIILNEWRRKSGEIPGARQG